MEKYYLQAEVRYYLWKNKITRKKFCEMCGVSYTHFTKLMKEDFSVPTVAVFKIAKAIDREVHFLLRERIQN